MKKLLILMQSLLVSAVAVTPALFSNVQKVDTNEDFRIVESIDIVDFSFDSSKNVDKWVEVPNLLAVMQNNPSQDEELHHMSFSLTNSNGDIFEHVYDYTSSEAFGLAYFFARDHGWVHEILNTQIRVSSNLQDKSLINMKYADKIPPIYEYNISLGSWNWESNDVMDKFLTSDVTFEYKMYFTQMVK